MKIVYQVMLTESDVEKCFKIIHELDHVQVLSGYRSNDGWMFTVEVSGNHVDEVHAHTRAAVEKLKGFLGKDPVVVKVGEII